MSDARSILIGAYAMLKDASAWCQGRDRRYVQLRIDGPTIVDARSVYGAIVDSAVDLWPQRATAAQWGRDLDQALKAFAAVAGEAPEDLPMWNDWATHDDVTHALLQTIGGCQCN